ncbi:MAG: glycosyltransferase [Pseudomonadota bacterium]
MTPRILIAVTHLMGSGHLVRMASLARALAAAGADVRLLAGGRPLAHLDLSDVRVSWLPPVASDGLDYARLLDADGFEVTPAYLARRQDAALAALARVDPHVLVTETWPLGRGALRGEYTALAAAARQAGARLWASVRDIPEPPSPKKAARAATALAAFDGLIVHGDRRIHDLAADWTLPDGLALHYAGLIAAPLPAPILSDEVLVAVGGGGIGRTVLVCAAAAAGLSARPWRLLVGGTDAEAFARSLPGPARAEPARSDYRGRLGGAAASVSLAGYNSVADLLQCATPAIVLPMAEAGEREQILRGAALADLGLTVLDAAALTPDMLKRAVETSIASGPRKAAGLPLDGAARAARLLIAAAATGGG